MVERHFGFTFPLQTAVGVIKRRKQFELLGKSAMKAKHVHPIKRLLKHFDWRTLCPHAIVQHRVLPIQLEWRQRNGIAEQGVKTIQLQLQPAPRLGNAPIHIVRVFRFNIRIGNHQLSRCRVRFKNAGEVVNIRCSKAGGHTQCDACFACGHIHNTQVTSNSRIFLRLFP